MSSKNDSDGRQGSLQSGGGKLSRAQIEAAQRLVRETLEADRLVLERDAKFAFRTTGV